MIAAELLGLAELVQKLVSTKAQLDQKYFDQFIKPIWDKFTEIHSDFAILRAAPLLLRSISPKST